MRQTCTETEDADYTLLLFHLPPGAESPGGWKWAPYKIEERVGARAAADAADAAVQAIVQILT